MNMWIMYLVLKLDEITTGLRMVSQVGLFLCGIATFILIAMICYHRSASHVAKDCWFLTSGALNAKKYLIRTGIAIIICGALSIFLPTTKQAAAIYFVPKVLNNKQIQKMPNKLVTLANDWMDEQIKSIKTK